MTDEPELPLAGLDAERPLPEALRARLESALLAAVAGGLPVPADEAALDAPRPLPEALRVRLESALLAEAAAAAASATTSAAAEAAGVVTSLDGRRRKVVAAWSAVAAVLLMVVAVAGLASRGHSGSQNLAAGGPTTTTAGAPASVPSDAGVPTESTSPATAAPAATATTRATRPRPTPSTAGRPGVPTPAGPPAASPISPAPPAPGAGAPASTDPGPAPPFYNSGSSGDAAATPAPAASSPSGGAGSPQGAAPSTQKSTAPAPAGPPLRVGIVTGDAAQEAGFRAYVDRLNQSGGVRGHEIDLVPVSPASPAADTIATVNLSAQPVAGPGGAPSWAGRGPLLETLTATENLLAGNGAVFSFASPPERQGHLAADALFPSTVKNRTAVIYAAPSGPLSDAVPAAMRAVLESRGVRVVVVTYDPDAPQKAPLREGVDAALLSLDPAAARAWVAEAKAAGYRPALGVAGIYSLADATLAPDLPEGARVISPYVVPAGAEGEAIRSAAGGTSAPVLHGWVGAKALAAAIWRTGADTPAELQSALEALTGWSPGLAPAYETRPGTRSRTPEGVLLQVQSGAFATDGAWRRDPF